MSKSASKPTESPVEQDPQLEQLAANKRAILRDLARKLDSSLDEFDHLVKRRFEGATEEITEQHAREVRQERTRKTVQSVLEALGGEKATLAKILSDSAEAFTDSLAKATGGSAVKDPALQAQMSAALSQYLQQVAINLQKIITVALDAERSGDTTHPKYYPPR